MSGPKCPGCESRWTLGLRPEVSPGGHPGVLYRCQNRACRKDFVVVSKSQEGKK